MLTLMKKNFIIGFFICILFTRCDFFESSDFVIINNTSDTIEIGTIMYIPDNTDPQSGNMLTPHSG
jgi:hypothetical protein